MTPKRLFDLGIAIPLLLLLSPLLLLLALGVKLDSDGPVFFRQERVGRAGEKFLIWKFRTMVDRAHGKGLSVTYDNDSRITKSGAFLRRYRLDEIPQLLNVIRGDMSLVGPRPEVSRYLQFYTEEDRRIILSVRPGMTAVSTLEFGSEAEMLSNAESAEAEYVEKILPKKLAMQRADVSNQSVCGDIRILLRTMIFLLKGR